MRRRVLVALAALVVAGCGGPRVHSTYAVKPFDTDIALGIAATSVPAPPPPRVVDAAGFPTPLVAPPRPLGSVSAPPPPATVPPARPPARRKETCPAARSDSFPKDPAAQDVEDTPAVGTYAYRQSGFLEVGGGRLPLPASVTRQVSDVRETTGDDGSRRFDHTLTTRTPNGSTLTETYRTIVGSTRGLEDGIHLVRSELVEAPGKTPMVFAPATPVLVVQLPAESATSAQGWQTVATDPLSRTSLQLSGRVGPRVRVDACGEVVAAWEVHLDGRIVSDAGAQTVQQTLSVATQYGGLFVATVLDLSWTAGTTPVHEHVETIVNGLRPVAP